MAHQIIMHQNTLWLYLTLNTSLEVYINWKVNSSNLQNCSSNLPNTSPWWSETLSSWWRGFPQSLVNWALQPLVKCASQPLAKRDPLVHGEVSPPALCWSGTMGPQAPGEVVPPVPDEVVPPVSDEVGPQLIVKWVPISIVWSQIAHNDVLF